MINTLLGIKKGMTSVYDTRGRRVGATVVELTPNFVTQIKSVEKDGYSAVQIGTGSKKSVKKPQLGHFKKAGVDKTLQFVREVRTDAVDDIAAGQEIKVKDVFSKGDLVKVTATSKGKGFAGAVKKFGFAGGPKTHGQSDRHRARGSSGSGTTPGRVLKGKRMAGHMGMITISLTGMEVVQIDKANNLITIKGGIPGPVGGLVRIQKQGVVKGYTPEPEEEEVTEEVTTEAAANEEPVTEQIVENASDVAATIAEEGPVDTTVADAAESVPFGAPAADQEGTPAQAGEAGSEESEVKEVEAEVTEEQNEVVKENVQEGEDNNG